jgi:predicted nucleotidyltransferase
MDKRLTQLVEKLQAAYGESLVSVILYGSAATGDHQARFSDFNVMCVLKRLSPLELEAGEDIFRWWREQGSPSPLLITEAEIERSTDCFAIEFFDIKRQHVLLYGKDVISGLQVGGAFYRAQVEHDLRAKLLRLRQKACGTVSNKSLLLRLLIDSLSTFCVLFRHALALAGEETPLKKRDIIERAGARFGFDAGAYLTLLDVREERLKPRQADAAALLEPYLAGIGAVIEGVDNLEAP